MPDFMLKEANENPKRAAKGVTTAGKILALVEEYGPIVDIKIDENEAVVRMSGEALSRMGVYLRPRNP